MTSARSRTRLLFLPLVAFALLSIFAVPASAQVPYDVTKTLEVLGETISNCTTGLAEADFTLPDDVTPGYEVIAAGFAPDGTRREIFATVTPIGTSSDGSLVRTIHVSADGFKPCTTVSFTVRFTPPGPVVNGNALPLTGSEIGFLISLAGACLLLGIALIQGSRQRMRTSRAS